MMRSRTRLPELLAPAGSRKAFLGALKAGADAVYLGGEKFGARAYAENFTREDIVRSVREAHIFGKKVYLTLNILTKESELEETVEFAEALWREGLDGVIVQDIGVLKRLRDRCPGLSLHASTQMSVTGPESVRYLKELGVCRVVPARELSLREIRAIKEEEPVEIESFIHGAMCYAYSGRCLISSFLGGRSGNRGRCAGTCRLPYKIIDSGGKERTLTRGGEMSYPLSMRDMCVLEILPDLIDAGIDSFKIEGRMKSPHYAAGVTALYRKYLDLYTEWDAAGRRTPWKVSQEDMKKLRALYLRSDLSTGYYYRRNGRELLTIGKPGYAGTDDALLEEIEEKYLREALKKEIRGKARFVPGERAVLEVSADDPSGSGRLITAQVYGETVQPARKRPMTEEEIEKRLRKTGDSLFVFGDLRVEVKGEVFLPVASLNAFRREALLELEERLTERTKEHNADDHAADSRSQDNDTASGGCAQNRIGRCSGKNGTPAPPAAGEGGRPGIWALVATAAQLRAALRCGAANIIVEETPELMAVMTQEERAACLAALPHVYRRSSREAVEKLIAGGFRGVLARNQEELEVLRSAGYEGLIVADGSLYQWNTEARDELLARCGMASLGWELSGADMLPLLRGAQDRQLIQVYGRVPLMISAGCVRKTAGACSRREEDFWYIEDRKGVRFPVRSICGHCCNVIYNSLPLSLHNAVAKKDPAVMAAAGWILSFTTESGGETEKILRWYMSGAADAKMPEAMDGYTTGHYRKSAL